MSYSTVEYGQVRENLPLRALKLVFFPNSVIWCKQKVYFLLVTLCLFILSTTDIKQIWKTVNVNGWGEVAEAVTPSVFQNLV